MSPGNIANTVLRKYREIAGRARRPEHFFWGISSFQMLAMFRRGMFYAFLSIYLRHFLGLSVTETTLFATGPMIANILFQTFVWGPFSDRRQLRRTLIVWGECLGGAGTLGVWWVHTWPADRHAAGYVIIVGLTLVEVFWSMSNIGWSALISDLYREEKRSAVQGRLSSVGGVGRMLGIWLGGLLYDGMGLKYAGWGFYAGALFFVASGAMFISVVPMLFVPEGGIRKRSVQVSAAAAAASGRTPVGVFGIFLAGMTLINFGRNSIAVILSQYLVLGDGFAVSSRELSYIFNTQSVAMIVAGLAIGWICRCMGDENVLMLGGALSLASLSVLAITGDIKMVYVASFLRGVSEVAILSSAYAFASALMPPDMRARLFSLFNATFFLSWGLAGTLIAGPIADLLIASGSTQVFAYRMSFVSAAAVTLAGLLVCGFLIYIFMPRRRP